VAVYVRNSIQAVEIYDLKIKRLEHLWLEIKASTRKILVDGKYRP